MRVVLRDFTVCLFAWFLVTVLVSLVLPCFAAYSIGVKAGDWVEYQGTASGFEPDEFLDLDQMEWMRSEVMSVSGNTVTVQMTAHYKDDSESSQMLVGDVATASGNLTFLVMPAGLERGDSFPVAMFDLGQVGLFINDTMSRMYFGATRIVNVLGLNVSEDFVSLEVHAYWDQATGVLLELSMQVSALDQNMQLSIEATETNMWSAGGSFGGGPASNLIFSVGIIATVFGIVAVVIVVFLRRPSMMPAPMPVGVPS